MQRPSFISNIASWSVYGVCWLLAHLPYRLLIFLGSGLGRLVHMLGIRRQVIEKNINTCFPEYTDKEKADLIRQNYRETGMMVTQTLKAFFDRSTRVFDKLEIEGSAHLENALAENRGVLLVSGHFTALDVGGRAISERFPVAGVYRPHNNAVMEYAVKKSRLNYAKHMFSRDQLRDIVKYLKKGGIIWYAPDQNYRRGSSVFSDFFGTPAATVVSTHQLARMTGCAVIFYSVIRTPAPPNYKLSLSQPMSSFPDAVQADTDRVNQHIEQMVRQAPSQYLWLHKRFKTRPPGEAPFYQ